MACNTDAIHIGSREHFLSPLSFILGFVLICGLLFSLTVNAKQKMDFWDSPKYGGNSFNEVPPDYAYFKALRATGASWVRLTFSKWRGEGKDFLIGDIDNYSALDAADLAVLKRVVEDAEKAGISVVITPLGLPGSRWSQQNNDTYDARLFMDKAFWQQSAAFWQDLANALKSHQNIVAYNLINEPVPEYETELDEHAPLEDRLAWYNKIKGSSRDLPAFYESVIAAIRTKDSETPIMVGGGWYSGALGLTNWPSPLSDAKVVYEMHMYEPWAATSSHNAIRTEPYRYPGYEGWYGDEKVVWNKAMLNQHLAATFEWAEKVNVPANRLVVSEFGCMRLWQDCATYLDDVLTILNAHEVHWAFYSFREDVWEGMDYELAPDVKPGQFYDLMDQGEADKIKRTPHPLLDVIKSHMTRD